MAGQQLQAAEAAHYAYIGTYTHDAPGGDSGKAHSEGIYVAKVDQETGKLELVQTVTSDNPSFLALSPDQRFLFAINEIDDFEGKDAGSVEAYRIDQGSGKIALINREALPGPIPAHLQVDPSGKYLVVALYMGGSFAVFPIGADGSLGAPTDVVQQHGSGPNKERQEAPHPHAVMFDPAGRYIATADLGIDKVETFELQDGKLAKVSEVALPPGSGPAPPRLPAGRLDALCHQRAQGDRHRTALRCRQRQARGAGRRGLDGAGRLSGGQEHGRDHGPPVGQVPLRFQPPLLGSSRCGRHRRLQAGREGRAGARAVRDPGHRLPARLPARPDGDMALRLNQKGDSIVQFAIDQETGKLTPTGNIAEVPTPVSLVFTTGG